MAAPRKTVLIKYKISFMDEVLLIDVDAAEKFKISMNKVLTKCGTCNIAMYRWLYADDNVNPEKAVGNVINDEDGNEIVVMRENHAG